MKLTPKKQSGFTLIEIVIVLAIAALIMVIVFVAVQGAQRSRRDTAIRNKAAQVVAGLISCASNNSGQVPGTTGACDTYITGAGGTGALGAAAPTAAAPGPTGGTTNCPATPVATNVTSGSATGYVSSYYWNEGSGSVVCISSKF